MKAQGSCLPLVSLSVMVFNQGAECFTSQGDKPATEPVAAMQTVPVTTHHIGQGI